MKFIVSLLLSSCSITALAQDKNSLSIYTGKYTMTIDGIGFPSEVVVESGALIIKGPDGSLGLERAGRDGFNMIGIHGTAVFMRNSSGKIDRVRMQAEGKTVLGTKDPAQTASRMMDRIWQKEQTFLGTR